MRLFLWVLFTFVLVSCDSNLENPKKDETKKTVENRMDEKNKRGIDIEPDQKISTKRRTALVIGNSNYKNSPLKNPVNDAKDMGAMLSQLGFKVTVKINCTRSQIRKAIRQLGKDLKKGGVGLFYFAGHGIQIQGVNYLIPIGADIEEEYEVKDEAIDANSVLRAMKYADNIMNVLILDACRNNPFTRNFRSSASGLAQMDAPSGSLIVYATAPGKIANDGDGRNGTFTKYLVHYMNKPGLEIAKLMRKVRVEVKRETNNKQIPWESSSLEGDFYFLTKNNHTQNNEILRSDSKDLKAKLEAEKKRLKKRLEQLSEKNVGSQKGIQKLEQDIQSYKSKIFDLEVEKFNLNLRLKAKTRELEKKAQELAEKAKELSSTTEKLRERNRELNDKERLLAEKIAQSIKLQKEYERQQDTNDMLRKQYKKLWKTFSGKNSKKEVLKMLHKTKILHNRFKIYELTIKPGEVEYSAILVVQPPGRPATRGDIFFSHNDLKRILEKRIPVFIRNGESQSIFIVTLEKKTNIEQRDWIKEELEKMRVIYEFVVIE